MQDFVFLRKYIFFQKLFNLKVLENDIHVAVYIIEFFSY